MNNTDAAFLRAYNLIFGVAVGDAMGFPVQFYMREQAKKLNITSMVAHKSRLFPAGSWSDDTSMTLALAASLCEKDEIDYDDIMQRFSDWLRKGAYTPNGKAFDVGKTCFKALIKYKNGVEPLECGGQLKTENGNGSLMRISPLAFYILKRYGSSAFDNADVFDIVHNVSRLTHAHPIALIGCDIFLAVLLALLNGEEKTCAVRHGLEQVSAYTEKNPKYKEAFTEYSRIADASFCNLPEEKISSSGYVVDTLEAALWCFLGTDSYRECILKILPLGKDTDTIGAVAGAMAGLYYASYAEKKIPLEWCAALQNQELLMKAVQQFAEKY